MFSSSKSVLMGLAASWALHMGPATAGEYEPYLKCLALISEYTHGSGGFESADGLVLVPGSHAGRQGLYAYNNSYSYFFAIPKSRTTPSAGQFLLQLPATDKDHPKRELKIGIESGKIYSLGGGDAVEEGRVIQGTDIIDAQSRAALRARLVARFSADSYLRTVPVKRPSKKRRDHELEIHPGLEDQGEDRPRKGKLSVRIGLRPEDFEALEQQCSSIPDKNLIAFIREQIQKHMPPRMGTADRDHIQVPAAK